MTIRPTRRTAAVASLAAVLIAVATIAACAPTGGGGGGGPTTTAGPTTTIPVTTTTVPVLTCTAGTIAAAPNPIPYGTLPNTPGAFLRKNIQVCYNVAASTGRRPFVTQCYRSPADPLFDYTGSCSNLSEYTQNPISSATSTFQFNSFYGTEVSGDENWGCFKASDIAPVGITKYTTCYLRFTLDQESNTTDQLSIPITFS